MSYSSSRYTALITQEYQGQPKFTATIEACVQPFVDSMNLLAALSDTDFDLDLAVGAQLDACGVRIGLSRYITTEITQGFFSMDTPGLGWDQGYWQGQSNPINTITALDDTTYRAALYAKVASNNWDGTFGTMHTLFPLALLPNSTVEVIDNQNMSMTVVIGGEAPPPVIVALLEGGYIPITPIGVQLTYVVNPTVGTYGLPTQIPVRIPRLMPAYVFKNGATSTLASAIDSTTTTVIVAAGGGAFFPSLSTGQVFDIEVIQGSQTEIMQVTAVSTDTFTVVRNQDGSGAFGFYQGSQVNLVLSSEALNSFAPAPAAAYANVTGSRALGSSYTNATGRWLHVVVATTVAVSGTLTVAIAGVTLMAPTQFVGNGAVSFVVPPGATYEVTAAGSQTLAIWSEL